MEKINKAQFTKIIKSCIKEIRAENALKDLIREVIKEETEYQKFFKDTLKKFGANSPGDLSDEKKKEFFADVKKNWKG